jgi:glycosyltransferase involved in cell wall biosynthesis
MVQWLKIFFIEVIYFFQKVNCKVLTIFCFLGLTERPFLLRNLGNENSSKKVLLYFKTEPFVIPLSRRKYSHTNLWEVYEMVRIIKSLGFKVDVVDRESKTFIPKDEYAIFLGLGSGQSGKNFSKYASLVPSAVKVLIASGPCPPISDKLVHAQYDRFNKRNNAHAKAMRVVGDLDFNDFASKADCFLVIGEKDLFCYQTYKEFNKPILSWLPSSNPMINFDLNWVPKRDMRHFLCVAGSGFICKGVDVLVEAFLMMPDACLHICGQLDEESFLNNYKFKSNSYDNIILHGFLDIGGQKFKELSIKCAYVILASSSEGCATSVTSAMRSGLVPIVTPETSIDVSNCGFLIEGPKDEIIKTTILVCNQAMSIGPNQYMSLVMETLKESTKFSQESFTLNFQSAFLNIMKMTNKKVLDIEK